MTTEIISVKVIGYCSLHREKLATDSKTQYESDVLTKIMRYKDGTVIPDEEIECVKCAIK